MFILSWCLQRVLVLPNMEDLVIPLMIDPLDSAAPSGDSINLQPQLLQPRGAVILNNQLYVTSADTNTIYRYT